MLQKNTWYTLSSIWKFQRFMILTVSDVYYGKINWIQYFFSIALASDLALETLSMISKNNFQKVNFS